MATRTWAACLLAFLSFQPLVVSQLPQDYECRRPTGSTKCEYWISPAPGMPSQKVIDLRPETVILWYNCHYLQDICKNAENFLATPRGISLHSDSSLDNAGFRTFGYDANTGESSAYRDERRRSRSCPTNWKNTHSCPEVDQALPGAMKQDVQWHTTALDPLIPNNAIKGKYIGNVLVEPSWIRYSCEEFPAASWVEGGDGTAHTRPASTRCAPIRCALGAANLGFQYPTGTKSEQDWQGQGHRALADALKAAVRRRNAAENPQPFPQFDPKQSVILFRFNTLDVANGVPVEVTTLDEDDEWIAAQYVWRNGDALDSRSVGNRNLTERELGNALHEKMLAHVGKGKGARHMVFANDTEPTTVGKVELHGLTRRWDQPAAHHSARSAHPPEVDLDHPSTAPLLKRASSSQLERAREIVAKAIAESARRNEARYKNPARNAYRLRPGTVVGGAAVGHGQPRRRQSESANSTVAQPPPLLEITDEIAAAAALVAEADAVAAVRSGNVTRRQAAPAAFWMQGLARKGTVPWGNNATYKVFRSVRDYGAVGNGVTDDTAAINRAMNDGRRCGEKCNGSTVKNAIVYFPPGTYLVSTTIPVPFGTQVIGDANNRPTLLASSGFTGLGVLSVNEYTGGGTGTDGLDQQWYVNTANFYRQLRNLRIDIQAAPKNEKITCLHYQVAQATSTQNLELIAAAGQTGMFAENGSGGQISDITFTGGAYGIYGGNQQFTAQRLTFRGCAVGVRVIWDWGWVWKSITMTNVGTGFKLLPDVGQSGHIGSASFLDSSFTTVVTVVEIGGVSATPGSGTTGIIMENVVFSGVTKGVATSTGTTVLAGNAGRIEHWALGPVYSGAGVRTFSNGAKVGDYRRAQQLLNTNTGAYFERAKPQYESSTLGEFVHTKDFGAKGDGVTDDTAAFQRALYDSVGKILFVDAGSYILTSTINVPAGSRIVGETWSQLVAYGSYFQDANDPKALVKVGQKGEVGNVELQDLIVTTKGPTAGAILIEWNIKASSAGSAGLWDVHVRVGGATGTQLTSLECPASRTGTNAGCNAASLMMHITPLASGYFENMWLWLADHDIDDPDLVDANNTMIQTSIYAARGLLVESTHATWLYGTSAEHAVFYQYNFHKARNVFAGMIQTESPYYQPTPKPPLPFAGQVGKMPGDPTYTCAANDEFSGCDESWALIIRESSNIFVAGAGLYSWFSTYTQTCIAGQLCQKALALFDKNAASVRIQHMITIGAKYMAVMNGVGIKAADNLNVNSHPFWSQISVLDVKSSGAQYDRLVWIDPKMWDMAQPAFTCVAPCYVQLPPWKSAASTINYPVLTVSSGAWTSTITKKPLTITEWRFKPLTVTSAGAGLKARETFGNLFPALAATTPWPAVVYTGPNGSPTTISPTVAAPTLPSSVGPNAPAPPQGAWPTLGIRAVAGLSDQPVVEECAFGDDKCILNPLNYGDTSGGGDGDREPDENARELATGTCPLPAATPPPFPSPKAIPHSMQNHVSCYDQGQAATHGELDDGIDAWCDQLGAVADQWASRNKDTDFFWGVDIQTKGLLSFWISFTFHLAKTCTWNYSKADCRRYALVPVDSCNCAGADVKQGGQVWNDCLRMGADPNVFRSR